MLKIKNHLHRPFWRVAKSKSGTNYFNRFLIIVYLLKNDLNVPLLLTSLLTIQIFMKPLLEKNILKDATINKVQFDQEWFYNFDDIAFYLKEDLSGVDTIFLPMTIDGEQEFVKCCTYEDIIRGRKEFK